MSGTAPRKHYNVDRNIMFAEDLTLTATANVQFAAADVFYKIGPGRMDAVLEVSGWKWNIEMDWFRHRS